jgi:DNA-binding XRE family transcriptional regulator
MPASGFANSSKSRSKPATQLLPDFGVTQNPEAILPMSTSTALLTRLRVWFGLSQTDLGYCFGLQREVISQVERGLRPLPLPASLPQTALTLAYHNTPTEPAPEALDRVALQKQLRTCRHRAGQLTYELSLLPERVLWARRRLAALPVLTAALVPAGTEAPKWLAYFAADARAELLRSGSTAQARLRARIAGLEAEAAAIAQELAA